jgi:hypothetical protein
MDSGAKLTGYEFNIPNVSRGIAHFYRVGCLAVKLDYKFSGEAEFKKLSTGEWRFRK